MHECKITQRKFNRNNFNVTLFRHGIAYCAAMNFNDQKLCKYNIKYLVSHKNKEKP